MYTNDVCHVITHTWQTIPSVSLWSGGSLRPGRQRQSRKPFAQGCRVIILMAACIAMDPSLPDCTTWSLTLQDGSRTLLVNSARVSSHPHNCKTPGKGIALDVKEPTLWQIVLGYTIPVVFVVN